MARLGQYAHFGDDDEDADEEDDMFGDFPYGYSQFVLPQLQPLDMPSFPTDTHSPGSHHQHHDPSGLFSSSSGPGAPSQFQQLSDGKRSNHNCTDAPPCTAYDKLTTTTHTQWRKGSGGRT